MSLFILSREEEELEILFESCLDLDTGEITDEEGLAVVEELKDELERKLGKKIGSYMRIIKNKEGMVALLKAEEKKFADRRKREEKVVAKMKGALKEYMERMGSKKIDLPEGILSFRKSTKLEITDEQIIPKQYIKTVETTKIDNALIKKHIKAGTKIEGAKIVTNQNLQLK